MPTTKNEAQTIISLVTEYLPRNKAAELLHRLNEEVGKKTDNESVQTTMQMLNDLLNHEANDFTNNF